MRNKINVRLLRRIEKHIKEEPRRYDQNELLIFGRPGERVMSVIGGTFPSCGTIGCIAGWAHILTSKKGKQRKGFSLRRSRLALGLTQDQADRLFSSTYADVWPSEFGEAYNFAATPARRVKIAIARIEHFIETGGAE